MTIDRGNYVPNWCKATIWGLISRSSVFISRTCLRTHSRSCSQTRTRSNVFPPLVCFYMKLSWQPQCFSVLTTALVIFKIRHNKGRTLSGNIKQCTYGWAYQYKIRIQINWSSQINMVKATSDDVFISSAASIQDKRCQWSIRQLKVTYFTRLSWGLWSPSTAPSRLSANETDNLWVTQV